MEDSNNFATKNKQAMQASVQLVVFDLGTEEYAVPIHDVKEVVKTPEITPVPNSPDFILGIINLRGNIIPILDLQKVFALKSVEKEKQKYHVLVTQTESPYGILVNKVTEVISVVEGSIQEAPEVTANKIAQDYVQGVVVIEDGTKIIEKHEASLVTEVKPSVDEKGETDNENKNQRALLILRVSKIVAARDLTIDPSVVKTPTAQTNQNKVQIK